MTTQTPQRKKKVLLTYVLPLAIIVVASFVTYKMLSSKPVAFNRPNIEQVEVVDVEALKLVDHQIFVDSYGIIEPTTAGNLVAQASGVVTWVAPNFESGRLFNKGDILLKIDRRDYEIEVTIAESEVANAQLALNEEIARSDQALRDWKKINPNREASALVLRQPQMASAQAQLAAAKARLAKAKLNLSRTNIQAPYDGYMVQKLSDLGQLVNSNMPVASIFASNSLEVRLPVASNRVGYLQFGDEENKPKIRLIADFAGEQKVWLADLDRTDSVIDDTTRQWFVTAKLPGSILKDEPYLKAGQFVSAQIEGRLLQDVFVIPSKLISQNNEVFIFSEGQLRRQKVAVLWKGEDKSVVDPENSGDLVKEGNLLVTSLLSFVADGAKAQVRGESVKKGDEKPPAGKQEAKL
ncbi:efflux RND transporter periplasmic adaptor subunit [Kangiella koreensis]|uniref:Efflux transporter, RND family, MFP subunit n=1 Tax=Kangiella koreensis (strain DSM 16069 / JCM 12317 / KCTC 12182 / SW-125) TaxID=523791 RepID=C7R7S5_KANKD|nr:efflux RND transporter periplasmic adaptor subunit [Kangiella koreensis]ACV27608.1 efflux transporter, RND family, MFP subunit [Kangiella koreensis DSM 16069]